MKKFLSIFLLMAITFNVFSKAIFWANYEINKSEITRKYCENKAKPKLHCDGKCHLKKQLKEEDKKEKESQSNNAKEKFETQFFVQVNFNFSAHLTALNAPHSYSPNQSHPHTHAVFSPPQC